MKRATLQIAELIPATARTPRPANSAIPQRRGGGVVVPVSGPTIVLSAATHFETFAAQTGNYRFLISPNASNTGIRFEVYRDGGFDRCFTSYWATTMVGDPASFGYPQEDATLSAGVVGVSAVWTVDLHLNAGELCAYQGVGASLLSGALEVQFTGDTAPGEHMGVS